MNRVLKVQVIVDRFVVQCQMDFRQYLCCLDRFSQHFMIIRKRITFEINSDNFQVANYRFSVEKLILLEVELNFIRNVLVEL